MSDVVFGLGQQNYEPTCIDIHLAISNYTFFFFYSIIASTVLLQGNFLKTWTGLGKNNAVQDIAISYSYMQYTPNNQKNKTSCTISSNTTQ